MTKPQAKAASRITAANLGVVLLVLSWALLTIHQYWGLWPVDLTGPYFAARFFAEGQPAQIYAATPDFFGYTMPEAWAAEARDLGHPGAVLARYVYPPLWAVLLAPLSESTSPLTFFNGALVVNITLLLASLILALRIAPARVWGAPIQALVTLAFLATSLATALALELGQPQILVIFLILASIHAQQNGRSGRAGLMLAVAASIKLTPALLALTFVMNRDWRGLSVFAIIGALLALASLALAGPALHWQYLERLALIDRAILVSSVNHTFEALAWDSYASLTGIAPDLTRAFRVVAEPGWIGALTLALRLALIGIALKATWRLTPQNRALYLTLLLYITASVTAPLGWAHAAILPLLLLPGLAATYPVRIAALLVLAFAFALSRAGFDMMFAQSDPVRLPLLAGVLTQLALFALTALAARRAAT